MSTGIKVSTALSGVPELLRAIKLADAATLQRTKAAIARGAAEVAARARALVPKRSGALAYSIRAEFSKNGMIGYVKAGYGTLLRRSKSSNRERLARHHKQIAGRTARFAAATTSKRALGALDLAVYAPVVERGDPRRHHRPHPFVIPALAQSVGGIVRDLERATVDGAKDGGML